MTEVVAGFRALPYNGSSFRPQAEPLTDEPLPIPPLVAGRYAVERELARGGMATVYLARDERHGRLVALKAFRLSDGSEGSILRFLNEIRVAARLAHPNILPVYDSGQAEDFLYYVMPYVAEENLRQRLEREGPLPVADALAIASQVASALAYAHSNGVIHRDITPGNIMFLAGQAMVADFGIARAISAGGWSSRRGRAERSGTPAYMSPEQASGESRADGRSDLYSLGCVLYEMLCGVPPFRARTPEEMLVAHVAQEPEPVQVHRAALPPGLQEVVGRALAKNAADRYPTVLQFAEALARVEPAIAPTPAKTGWRRLVPAAAVAVLGYALFVSATAARKGAGPSALDPGYVAVAPFLHREAASPLPLTGEQCTRLLRQALTRWDDVTLVDSRWFSDRVERLAGAPSLEDLLRIAREARAGRLLGGEVWSLGDSIRIRGVLYNTGRGARIVRERSVTVAASLADLEARFNELADSLLLPRAQTPAAAPGALGTRVIAAWQAYDSAHADLARWDLPGAAAGFSRALERDPGYGLAHLWLAQTGNWQGNPPDTWRDHALAALGGQPPLASRDREWALALAALAEARYPEACERYQAMIGRDSLDFRGWYGRAECRASDPLLLKDARSPSGWAFRTSYQGAIDDYQRALLLVPSAHRAFKGAAFDRLVRLYFGEPNIFRRGSTADLAAATFAAFPALDHDTLTFVPWPVERIGALPDRAPGGADPAAIERNLRRLEALTAEWIRAFPESPSGLEAAAVVLELRGEFGGAGGAADSAVQRIREARRHSGTSVDRVRLASLELRLLVKRQRFQEAARLADSLLDANRSPGTEEAPYLAAAAALTGRATLAAELARLAAPGEEIWAPSGIVLEVPLALREAALALETYAALGAPADSLERLYRLLSGQVTSTAARSRREALDAALLDRSRTLLFPNAYAAPGPRAAVPLGYLLDLQESVRRRDVTGARKRLAQLAAVRARNRVSGVAVEATLGEALAELSLADTAAAATRLDRYLEGLAGIGLDLTERSVASGSLVRVMALRARLAAAQGERRLAGRWASEVVTLWQHADPSLQPVVHEMRVIAGRPS